MILKIEEEQQLKLGNLNSDKVTLSLDDQEKLLYMLSQGNYSLPIHSTIRELCSNAYDAVLESGKDPLECPVIVGIDDKKFWVKDSGVGIDLERMKVINKFGASTKSNDPNLLGMFGIGMYAPLSYTSKYTLESVKDGVKRVWLISKDGVEINSTLISEILVEEENGTLITIPLKQVWSEVSLWKDAIKDTLRYFRGIIVENQDFDPYNKRSIIEGKNFVYTNYPTSSDFHIILDQVVYYIPLKDLGLPNVSIPIGIKFSTTDGLVPTPSREAILVNTKSTEIILDRLGGCIEELRELKEKEESTHIVEYLFKNRNVIKFDIGQEKVSFSKSDLDKLCHFSKTDPINDEYTPVKNSNLIELIPTIRGYRDRIEPFIFSSITLVGKITDDVFTKVNARTSLRYFQTYILVDAPLDKNTIRYFKTLAGEFVFVKFKRTHTLKDYLRWDKLNIGQLPKSQWREAIVAFQSEEDYFINSLPKLSSYQTQIKDWVKAQPKSKKQRVEKDEGEITVRFATSFQTHNSDYNCKFEPEVVSLSQLTGNKDLGSKLYIYSDDRKEVDQLWYLSRNRRSIQPVLLNKTEIKHIESKPNFMTYSDFASGKSRLAHKYITAIMIYRDIKEHDYLKEIFKSDSHYSKFKNRLPFFELERTTLRDSFNNISSYLNKWLGNATEVTPIIQSMIETFQKGNLIDRPMWNEYLTFKEKAKPLFFLPHLNNYDKVALSVYVKMRQADLYCKQKSKHEIKI